MKEKKIRVLMLEPGKYSREVTIWILCKKQSASIVKGKG